MDSLNQLVWAYLESLRVRRLSAAHVQAVSYRLDRLLADVAGETAVSDVTGDDIAAHFDRLEEGGLAYATLAGQKSTLRAFWRWAVENGLAAADPTAVLLGSRYSYNYRPVRNQAAPRDDLQAVLLSLDAFVLHRDCHPRDVRDAALVSLTADSAKRRGELWNLRRRDIELALRRGEIRNGLTVFTASSHGKTGQTDISFFVDSARLLRMWLDILPTDATWLWTSLRTGKRLRVDALGLGFRRVCEFAGVPGFRFHAVRKRAVTDIIEVSGDTKMGQMLAGHADERTTQLHYNAVERDRVIDQAAKLAEQRRGSDNGVLLATAFFGRRE